MTLFDLSDPLVIGFDVVGTPSTQGSVRAFIAGGRAHVAQGGSKASREALSSWREAVAAEARRAQEQRATAMGGQPGLWKCPIQIRLTFRLQRPASEPKTRRTWPVKARSGDVDKLARAVLDALTGVLIADDSQVVGLVVSKDWGDPPGCEVRLRAVAR